MSNVVLPTPEEYNDIFKGVAKDKIFFSGVEDCQLRLEVTTVYDVEHEKDYLALMIDKNMLYLDLQYVEERDLPEFQVSGRTMGLWMADSHFTWLEVVSYVLTETVKGVWFVRDGEGIRVIVQLQNERAAMGRITDLNVVPVYGACKWSEYFQLI